MKNRKWQRVLSWLLTLTMLLGTFESNILAVNAMDDEAVEADAEIDEEDVATADEDVEEPEVVGGTYTDNSGVSIEGSLAAKDLGPENNQVGLTAYYGKEFNPIAKFTAKNAGDNVTWKLFERDSWKEATLSDGLQGTAEGAVYTISGTPTGKTGYTTYKLSAVSANGTASANVLVNIFVDPVDSDSIEKSAKDAKWDGVKMGYTVDASAASSSTNVVPKTITLTNGTGIDLTGLTVKLTGDAKDSFDLTGAGTDVSIAKNGTLDLTVAPKAGLSVKGLKAGEVKTFSADISISADYLVNYNTGSNAITIPVELKLAHNMDVTVTKAGEAFTGNKITVSAGNAMPTLVFTATGGNDSIAWQDNGIQDKLPKGVTANRNGAVLTISGTPTISSDAVNTYSFDLVAYDNAGETTNNNTISGNFTIDVVKADVSYKVNGEDKLNVVKTAAAGYYQEDVALTVTVTNNGESAVKVNANLDNSANFSFYPDKKAAKTIELAAGASADLKIYPETSVEDETVKITFTGDSIDPTEVTYRLICKANVLLITEPADGKLTDAIVGEKYSYTFKSEGTVPAADRKWSISDNAATISANDLKNIYGLTLSDNGVLSGTPKAVSADGIKILVAVSSNDVVSTNEVTLKIVSTNSALVVSANGVELKGKTASDNVVDLGTVNTKLTASSISNNTAKIWIKNTSEVDLGNVDFSIVKTEKLGKDGKYVDSTLNIFDPADKAGVVNSEFTVSPNVAVIGADAFGADNAGTYRALCKVNTNANIVAKEFYVTLTIKNAIEITGANKALVFDFNKEVKGVSFNAVSKNSTTPLKDVTWSWTASGNSSLPEGLTLDEKGNLTGTPTKAGSYDVSVNAVDNNNQETDTKSFTITVNGTSAIELTKGNGDAITAVTFDGIINGDEIKADELEVAVKITSGDSLSDVKVSVEDLPGYAGSAQHFKLSTDTIAKINKGGFEKFTVVPVGNTESGTFKAKVVVSSNAIEAKSFEVSFTVADKLTINDVPADKLVAEVGQNFSLTVSAASISYNKVAKEGEVNWTISEVSANGAYERIFKSANGSAIEVNNYLFAKAGTYYYVVSANIAKDDTLKVPVNKAELKLTVEVGKSASVNVIGVTANASGYSTGKATPENPSASNNVTAYTFASRAEGYTDTNKETATFTVKNDSWSILVVSGNASSTDFVVTGGDAAPMVGTEDISVSPKKGLAAGTYTADLVVNGPEVADKVVTLSFTVEEAKDSIEVSSNNVVVAESGLTLKETMKGKSAVDTTVVFKNTGNVDINVVSINEVLDADGTDIDINDNSKFKLTINKASATGLMIPDATKSFTIRPTKTDVAGEYTAYVKITYTVGTSIKTPVVFKVNYTIYKDSVSVNVTPSANTVSINGTASVSENYSTAYSVGFSVANGEAGVAGDTTETLYNLRVALTGADADKFELTAAKVSENSAEYGADKIAKGASYSFNIAAKSGLSYGVYKATLKVSASNMTPITKEIVFTVTGKAGSYTKDINSKGVSDNVAVNANRIRNTLQALVDNSVAGVTANGAVYTVQKDITVDFTVADSVEIKLDPKHSISTDSVSVNRNGKTATTTVGDGSYYDTIYFNIYNIVTFKANGGKFADGSDIVSVNVVNGSKVAELPSVSKNNASLKGWMDEKLNEFTTATTVSQDIVLTASWSAHTYPASASGNKAGQIEWTWNGTASDNFAGTFVTIYCTDTDCPDKAASAIKLDATITVSGKDASCTKGEAKVYTATAAKDGNVYTDTQTVAGEEGLGHKWVVDASNPVWAEDYSSVSINKTCEAAYHTSEDGDKTVAIVTKNISFNGAEATCTTSGNGVYTATFTSEDDPAISENIVVSVNAAEVPALGHDYKVKAEWTDNGFENTPSVNAVLVCSRCEEVVSENLTVSVELVSENEAKKDYKAVVTYEDKTYESEIYSVMNHTEHSWSVSFNWTGTTSENAVVEAIATCANGGETVVLSPDVEKKVTSKNVTYTATVKDPDGKEWSEKYTVNLESGEGKVGGGEGIEIRDLEDSYPLTGKQIKPAITVWDLTRDVQLAYKVDYTVKYGKNNAAGEKAGSITIVGKGNYTGQTVTANFDIVDPMEGMSEDEVAELAALKKAKIAKIDAATFTGSAIYPETISIKTKNDGEVVMKSNGDGTYEAAEGSKSVVVVVTNNINKGTATVAVTGSDATTLKKTFKIKAADINAAVIADIDATTFAVKGATPALDVTFKASDDAEEIALVQGMDYTVSYKNNKAVGTATVTLKGKGNFAKKGLSKTFEVTAFDLSEVEEDAIAVNAFTGIKAGKVKVTVVDGNGSVIPAKNYTVEVFQGESETALAKGAKLAAGDATIKITAKGSNLTESVEKSIVVADKISKAKVKVNLTKTYTGEAITLTDEDFNNIAVTLNKAPLVYGEDFVVASYANNIKKGKMTVTIEGIGKYSGTKTFKVKIVPQEMKPAE
ncbi:MAG: putative Ig domain-containing protein [Lachnospiraceae bacterium]|nr:putative Ig domain-containing protein [Lachnospiraceae bacterium]